MGYTTNFDGTFKLSPGLNEDQIEPSIIFLKSVMVLEPMFIQASQVFGVTGLPMAMNCITMAVKSSITIPNGLNI